MEISKAGKLPANKTEIPFEIPLKTKGNKPLYETYHGVFINVQVKIKVNKILTIQLYSPNIVYY
jgi:hypothetical protein